MLAVNEAGMFIVLIQFACFRPQHRICAALLICLQWLETTSRASFSISSVVTMGLRDRAYFLHLLPLDTCCSVVGIHDRFGQTLWNPFTWLHLAATSNSWRGGLVWGAQNLKCFLELISLRIGCHVEKQGNILFESHLECFNLNWLTSSLTTHLLL